MLLVSILFLYHVVVQSDTMKVLYIPYCLTEFQCCICRNYIAANCVVSFIQSCTTVNWINIYFQNVTGWLKVLEYCIISRKCIVSDDDAIQATVWEVHIILHVSYANDYKCWRIVLAHSVLSKLIDVTKNEIKSISKYGNGCVHHCNPPWMACELQAQYTSV